jgi:hypothetical protein
MTEQAITIFVTNPALPRAIVLGGFGGIGLSLTAIYSRRGPLIFPVYAAILAALALLLSRYSDAPFSTRLGAALAGFLVASAALYVTVSALSSRARRELVFEGKLRTAALNAHLSLAGHAWRILFLVAVGALLASGIAYIAG